MLDPDTGTGLVPLGRLLLLADPLEEDVWGCGALGRGVVLRELQEPTTCRHDDPEPCRACEARRIAWFVNRGVDLHDLHPITVDVGVEGWVFEFHWPILDGNHRVAALAVGGADLVPVQVMGDMDAAVAWFAGDDTALPWLW